MAAPPKPEAPKPEPPKPEAPKPEPPKPEPPKVAKSHAPRPALILVGEEDSAQFVAHGYLVQVFHFTDTGDKRDFGEWIRQLGDAITQLRTTPDVDSNKIGLVGMKAGAALALHRAQIDPRVKAVVEYYGAYRVRDPANASKLPPVMIVGDEAEAQRLDALLTQYHVPHERSDTQHAPERVIDFLGRYLVAQQNR